MILVKISDLQKDEFLKGGVIVQAINIGDIEPEYIVGLTYENGKPIGVGLNSDGTKFRTWSGVRYMHEWAKAFFGEYLASFVVFERNEVSRPMIEFFLRVHKVRNSDPSNTDNLAEQLRLQLLDKLDNDDGNDNVPSPANT